MDVVDVSIPPLDLPGILRSPIAPRGLVVFAHGSGSSRLSPRNTRVAEALGEAGLATLLFDLLAAEEETDRRNVFDIPLLAERLVAAVEWRSTQPALRELPVGLFGASTGAAAALVSAAQLGDVVGALVSRGGRPDLAGQVLEAVRAPTLLIVGGQDHQVLTLNKSALARLRCSKALKIVPGATHLFTEPGALEAVMREAAGWFTAHLGPQKGRS
jgi:pimeloyl-ACP methyl ester carboxylesterase